MKKIYFTVTNDLVYDQRMKRICGSLASNGFDVTLVGRLLRSSLPLKKENYTQKRLSCFFTKGKIFYAEYNARLFFYLLQKRMDGICAIDLDTIAPCLVISKFKKITRIYDAHELFTELKEVISRPAIKKWWTMIERAAVPQFQYGYTVSDGIAAEFRRRYNVNYETIRNLPILKPLDENLPAEKFILYQGAVNEARGLEYLIPAMTMIDYKLVICGDGNFRGRLKELIKKYKVESKVELKGMLHPDELWKISQKATIAVAFPEKEGLNQYYALPNKYFDYIHAGLPQVTVDYPEYKKINDKWEVAILTNRIDPETIAEKINNLMSRPVVIGQLRKNCLKAREELNWQQEEKKLVSFYKNIFQG